MRESISVKDFGASGVGSQDDATSIQAAVNYVNSLPYGAELVFPHGTYLVGATITFPTTANVRFDVAGHGARIGPYGSFLGSLVYFGQAENAISAPPMFINGLTFFGPYLTPLVSPLIVAENANGINFSCCSFVSGTQAISLNDCYAVIFTRCKFIYQSEYGIVVISSINNFLVDACQFGSVGSSSVGADIYIVGNAYNINVTNSDFEGGHTALNFNSGVTTLRLQGNYIESKTSLPIYFGATSHSVHIDGNWVGYNSGMQTWYNIKSGVLKHNIFWDQAQAVDPSCANFDIGNNTYNGTSTPIYRTWTAPILTNGYSNFGTPWETAGYTCLSDGTVVLRGMVTAVADNVAFQLPAGYRPAGKKIFATSGSVAAAGYVAVSPDGSVTIYRSANGSADLGAVRFMAGA